MVHFSSRSCLDLNVYTNVHKLPSGAPEFLLHIEIEARAARVLAEYGPLSALIVLPQDESVCCRVGFDVVALPEGDAIPPELVEIGMASNVPLYAAWTIDATTLERVIVATDAATGELMAVFA